MAGPWRSRAGERRRGHRASTSGRLAGMDEGVLVNLSPALSVIAVSPRVRNVYSKERAHDPSASPQAIGHDA
ncbi:MAG TPA: hypothetical protein VF940_32135 [Streptosporangiaceae bacterium]